jgi:hypothetical protein
LQIEPDAEIVQGHFGGQASLEAGHVMRAFTGQAEGVEQFIVDGLNDLSQTGQPPAQSFGPALLAPLMWRADQSYLILLLPLLSRPLTSKPFVGHIRAVGRQASTGQAWRRCVTSRKQSGRQMLIVRPRAPKAEAGNHPLCSDTRQEMKAFIPADISHTKRFWIRWMVGARATTTRVTMKLALTQIW